MNRRSFLSAGAGAIGGIGLMAAAGGEASAAVRLEQLTVEGGDHEIRGDVSAVWLTGEVGYSFDVPARAPGPELYQVTLCVGADDERVGSAGGRPGSRSASGAVPVEADILQADAFSAGDFAPGESPVSVDVPVLVRLDVMGSNETVAEASRRDTATVTVSQAGYEATLHGAVGGELTIEIS